MKKLKILFTDGSCFPNPGPGGWAFIIEEKETTDSIFYLKGSGWEHSTTNNRMELTAAFMGLSAIDKGEKVTLVTDSEYLIGGMTKLKPFYQNRNYNGIANADLWKSLHEVMEGLDVTCEKIKGHSGHPQNEECDKMALEARKQASGETAKPARCKNKKDRG